MKTFFGRCDHNQHIKDQIYGLDDICELKMKVRRGYEIFVDGLFGTEYGEAVKQEGEYSSRADRDNRKQEPEPNKRILPHEITPAANLAAKEPNYE
jgi:hypothetical protein